MRRLYSYVGPAEIARSVSATSRRLRVESAADIRRWAAETVDCQAPVTATFIIDDSGDLWIADRRSEHVACARGGWVLSAGEMTFAIAPNRVEATYVTNQSTGYCPQPDSWAAVAAALDHAGIDRGDDFHAGFEFRRCDCGQINIVKLAVYECSVCGGDLPTDWNLA